MLGDGLEIFLIRLFSLPRPIKSTYEEQSRKGPRHNLDLSRKKWETPWFGTPPGLASLKIANVNVLLGCVLLWPEVTGLLELSECSDSCLALNVYVSWRLRPKHIMQHDGMGSACLSERLKLPDLLPYNS